MVSAAKAFAKEPPREPLDNMHAVVRDFKWRYKDRKLTDQVVEFARESDSFWLAAQRACMSLSPDGKLHNHQSRVRIRSRQHLRDLLARDATNILGLRSFDDLHDLIKDYDVWGIGPVTVYDVAVRLGAWLELEPESVYLHAGVRLGVKALGIETYGGRVELDRLPAPLNRMKADDVEDIMCTYREVFELWKK